MTKTSEFIYPPCKEVILQRHCEIIATASALPETIVTNDEIRAREGFRISDRVLAETIGATGRRVAPKGVADSDLLAEAAKKCLDKAGITTDELSKIICNKFIGDRLLPPTASMVQSKLECSEAVQSYDIDGGANSFLQAFDLASKLINMGDGYILIVSGGINNALVSAKDPRNAFLFGDGATAILLAPSEKPTIEASYQFSNPAYRRLMMAFTNLKELRNEQLSKPEIQEKVYDLYQSGNWMEAREFLLEAMHTTCEKLLSSAKLKKEQIDHFLITENNRRLWSEIVEELNIDSSRVVTCSEKLGNTMSAMIPMQINALHEQNRIKKGDRLMILSIGEGISGGGLIYTVN